MKRYAGVAVRSQIDSIDSIYSDRFSRAQSKMNGGDLKSYGSLLDRPMFDHRRRSNLPNRYAQPNQSRPFPDLRLSAVFPIPSPVGGTKTVVAAPATVNSRASVMKALTLTQSSAKQRGKGGGHNGGDLTED
jgi:hypothetical protein